MIVTYLFPVYSFHSFFPFSVVAPINKWIYIRVTFVVILTYYTTIQLTYVIIYFVYKI